MYLLIIPRYLSPKRRKSRLTPCSRLRYSLPSTSSVEMVDNRTKMTYIQKLTRLSVSYPWKGYSLYKLSKDQDETEYKGKLFSRNKPREYQQILHKAGKT